MEDLIAALQIFLKYGADKRNPTHCEHDVLIVRVDDEISEEDIKRLSELSFDYNEEYEAYTSYRFGSA